MLYTFTIGVETNNLKVIVEADTEEEGKEALMLQAPMFLDVEHVVPSKWWIEKVEVDDGA